MEDRTIKILIIGGYEDSLLPLEACILKAFPKAYVSTASGNRQGLEAAAAEGPDVILLDRFISQTDGIEVCTGLKADKKLRDIPVLFVTAGRDDQEYRRKAWACGADAFLFMPFDETELTAQIQAMVKIKGANLQRRDENAAPEDMLKENAGNLQNSGMQAPQPLKAAKSEQIMIEAIFNSIPGYLYVYDDSGRLIKWNKNHETMTGYTAEEMPFMTLEKWFDPEDLVKVNAAVHDVFEKGYGVVEAPLKLKNGRKMMIRSSGAPLELNGHYYFTGIGIDITEQIEAQVNLRASEEKYRRLFETMSQGVIYQAANGEIVAANPAAERALGMTFSQMQGRTSMDPHWKGIREDGSEVAGTDHPAMVALRTGKPFGPFIMGVFQPQLNDHVWLSITATPLFRPGETTPYQVYTLFQDITAERKAQQDYRLLFHEMIDAFALHEIICDDRGQPVDYRFLAINPAFERMTGLKSENILGKTVLEIMPGTERYWIEKYGRVALTGKPEHFENYSAATGKYFSVSAYQPKQNQFACTFTDITERKAAEENLVFVSTHDYLTGLYNRRFFDAEVKRLDAAEYLPLSFVIGDINGLKLINDSFGREAGDTLIVETARILSRFCLPDHVLAKTGGDDFSILMPKTRHEDAVELIRKMQSACGECSIPIAGEPYQISISFGSATKENMSDDIESIFIAADANMNQRKLLEKSSSQSAIISSIQAAMLEKSHETETHSERLVQLARETGMRLKLSQTDLDHLELLAALHDIGKIGVSENVLRKPGKLDSDEWAEMKKHPEIGYRIALSTSNLAPIAEYILSHHERWDGGGYPQKLAGTAIPLLSRILAVADAYDAMTQDRVYRKALSHQQAIEEIVRNSGTQFDPRIAQIFCDMIAKFSPDRLRIDSRDEFKRLKKI